MRGRGWQEYTVYTGVYKNTQEYTGVCSMYTGVYRSIPAGQQQLIRADIRSVEQESSSISGDESGRGVIICTAFSRAREPAGAVARAGAKTVSTVA